MKKIIILSVVIALIFCCFTSCTGYNKIMRDHLSDSNNYATFEVILNDICYLDSNTHQFVSNSNVSESSKGSAYFCVQFETYENVAVFIGGDPNKDIPIEEFVINFEITEENNKILYENGFYDDFALGDRITIAASHWIYMDTEFFYIAQVEYRGKVYLNFEEGLRNIVEMMNNDKSFF